MKGWLVRLGAPYPFTRGPSGREYTFFWDGGFCSFWGWGFSAFWDGVLQRPANKIYQGLESNSYSHYRVFGGDQSLGACNSRVDLWGGGIYLAISFSGVECIRYSLSVAGPGSGTFTFNRCSS